MQELVLLCMLLTQANLSKEKDGVCKLIINLQHQLVMQMRAAIVCARTFPVLYVSPQVPGSRVSTSNKGRFRLRTTTREKKQQSNSSGREL